MASSSSSSSHAELTGATEIITRVIYVAPLVHVYAIPPLQSNRGHVASTWTASPQNEIFTARLRVVETSDPNPPSGPSGSTGPSGSSLKPPKSTNTATASGSGSSSNISISITLEDRQSNDLFAGAAYTQPNVVEATVDSSRFFALRVTGDGGRKAVLGIGFEERGEALDFSIALQEARKVLGLELELQTAGTPRTPSMPVSPMPGTPGTPRSAGGLRSARTAPVAVPGRARPHPSLPKTPEPPGVSARDGGDGDGKPAKRDWSLKEGQMLHVDLGGKGAGSGGVRSPGVGSEIEPPSGGGLMSAGGGAFSLLPPPPSAKEVRAELRRGSPDGGGVQEEQKTLEELGFDDGEFGEFQ